MTRRPVSQISGPHHAANATAKAGRAMIAIVAVIDRLIGDPDVPEVVDRRSGYRWMSQELIARNSPAAWQMIGIAHDLINDRHPRTLAEITDFRTSREILFPMLADAADREDRVALIRDPFGIFGNGAA